MNQQFNSELIEQIVQEVIRRLVERGAVVGDGAGCDANELVLEDKLITLAKLDGRLNGIARIVVGDRAIVTPAVKDELNDRSIELIRR